MGNSRCHECHQDSEECWVWVCCWTFAGSILMLSTSACRLSRLACAMRDLPCLVRSGAEAAPAHAELHKAFTTSARICEAATRHQRHLQPWQSCDLKNTC